MRAHLPKACLVVVLLAAVVAVAQPPETEESTFSEVVDVDVVEVNVRVTDRQGNTVPNLTAADFEVFEDGDRVEITNFRVVSREGGATAEDTPRTERERPPMPVVPEAAAIPPARTEVRPPHLIFFIDNANIRPLHRTRVLNELRRFIVETRLPGARMMVVSNDRHLKMRRSFTTDTSAVLTGLDEVEKDPVFGETAHDDFRELVREIEDRYSRQAWLENRVRAYAEETSLGLKQSLRTMRQLIDTLAGLKGRKALVYVSDGLPLSPAEELYHALERRFENMTVLHRALQFNSSRDFEELAHAANTAGVAFYTLHAAGLEAPMTADAEVAGSGIDGLRLTVDSVRLANTQGSGRLLAAETGGLAFVNQNSFSDGLAQMIEDLSHYYSLGYRPLRVGDGRYHKIEVKTRDKRLNVRHRQGYRDRSRSRRMEDLVSSTVSYGYGENPLAATVSIGSATAGDTTAAKDTLVVPVRVAIPLANVILVPRGTEHRGHLKLFVTVQGRDGGTSPTQEIDVPISIPEEALERALASVWTQEFQLRMRRGPHLLVVGVWDEIGQESSVASQRVVIGG